MPRNIVKRLKQIDAALQWGYPHLLWITGLIFLTKALYPGVIGLSIYEYPQATMFTVGLLTFLAGREVVGYRKKLRRARYDAERYRQERDDLMDAGYGK